MGTIYYLVDDEGKNVLDVEKAWWLDRDAERRPITAHRVWHASEDIDGVEWAATEITEFLTTIAQGRPCRLVADFTDEGQAQPWLARDRKNPEWIDHDHAADGWSLWSLYQQGRDDSPWRALPSSTEEWPTPPPREPRLVEQPRTAGGLDGLDAPPPAPWPLGRLW